MARSIKRQEFSSRTIAVGNVVGITLKRTLGRVEPPPAVWNRIRRQVAAQQRKDVLYRTVQSRSAKRGTSKQPLL